MFEKFKNNSEKTICTILGTLENTLSINRKMKFAPTFIIGPPRSGTTLLGQIVCHTFEVSYIPNLAIRFKNNHNKLPPIVTMTRLAKLLGYTRNVEEKFESYYGSSNVLGGSSDSDFIWRDILPMGYLDRGDLKSRQRRFIHRVTAGIERVFNKPFVDKCVGHSLRIPALLEIFPDALFIRCRRNPLAVAQSVYLGRTRNDKARSTWPTPHVTGYEALFEKSLIEQCAGQQYLFDKDIDRGLEGLPADRCIEIDYDDVCTQPKVEVGRIYEFMLKHQINVKRANKAPKSFPPSNYRRLDLTVYNELVDCLEKIYGKSVTHLIESETR